MNKKTIGSVIAFWMIGFQSIFSQPSFDWAQSFGFRGMQMGNVMITDSSDNVLMAGIFKDSIDLDTSDIGGNGFLKTNRMAGFVSKFDENGKLIWIKKLNPVAPFATSSLPWEITISGISTDKVGNVYLTGKFFGLVDFNPSETEENFLSHPVPPYEFGDGHVGTADIFILKLDPDGSFIWVRQIGGQAIESDLAHTFNQSGSIAVDKNNDIFVSGQIAGDGASFKDADGTPHPLEDLGTSVSSGINKGLFVLKLKDNGDFVWVRVIKHTTNYSFASDKESVDLEVDPFGDVLVAGHSLLGKYSVDTIDFDPGVGKVLQGAIYTNEDKFEFSFVLKLKSNGDYGWVAINKGGISNWVNSIDTDADGNVYYTGNFNETGHKNPDGSINYFDADPDPVKTHYLNSDENKRMYLIKLDKNMQFIYALQFGGLGGSIVSTELKLNPRRELILYGTSIIFDPSLNLGQEVDFDPDPTSEHLSEIDPLRNRLFILKLDKTTKFMWVAQFGVKPGNYGETKMALSSSGCSIFVGATLGTGWKTEKINDRDFDPNQGVFTLHANPYDDDLVNENVDIFLERLNDYSYAKHSITGGTDFCPGESITLQVSDTLPNYLWSPGGATTPTITVNNEGKYTVTAQYECVSVTSDTLDIELLSVSQISLIPETTIKSGEQVTLTTLATNASNYSWIPNDSTLSCNDCDSPIATPTASTEYCITIKSVDSCATTKCVKINVVPTCKDIFIPNAFSPNGDGNNDVLELYTKFDCVTEYNFQIFDRWGEKVFEATKPTESWDGKFNGKELDSAVFVYQLKYKTIEKAEYIQKSGNVSIIK